MTNKKNIVYLILGLGLGIIITNILHSTYPKIKFVELNDNEIIERARDLGMVSIKESIKTGKETVETEADELEKIAEKLEKEVKELEESEKNETEAIIEEEILVVIESGMNLTQIASHLYDIDVIEDVEEFAKLVRQNGLSKKMSSGQYAIKKASSYSEIIKLLTGVNPQNN